MHYGLTQYTAPPLDDAEVLRRFGHLVRRAAVAMSGRTGVDPDELWSAGALGLLEAVRRFDPARGVKLEAFVSYRVRGAMLDELRRMDRLPRRLRGRVAEVEKVRRRLTQELGREPTRDEVSTAAELDAADIDRLDEAKETHASLDAAAPVAAEGSVEELLVGQEMAGQLKEAVATLPERYQTVLSLRYVEELTLKEIAAVLGVSEPRICQIHNAAVIKLRAALGAG